MRPNEGQPAQLAPGQAHHSEHQTDRRDGLPGPEEEHPPNDPRFEPSHTSLYATFESADVCFDLSDPAVELGIESPEVQVVELTQLGSVRDVHLLNQSTSSLVMSSPSVS